MNHDVSEQLLEITSRTRQETLQKEIENLQESVESYLTESDDIKNDLRERLARAYKYLLNPTLDLDTAAQRAEYEIQEVKAKLDKKSGTNVSQDNDIDFNKALVEKEFEELNDLIATRLYEKFELQKQLHDRLELAHTNLRDAPNDDRQALQHCINTIKSVKAKLQYEITNLQKEDGQDELKEQSDSLQDELKNLNNLIATRLYENSELQSELHERLLDAQKILFDSRYRQDLALLRVENEVKSVQGIVNKEINLQNEDEKISKAFPRIIVLYIGLIVGVIILVELIDYQSIPIIGVPISILAWASIGSLAAILYRFYSQKPGRMRQEYKWLIARPIIGIIMGAFVYLSVLSGYLIIGTSVGEPFPPGSEHLEVLWVLAFLAGFSDKFFEATIRNLVGRFSNTETEDTKSESDEVNKHISERIE